jgi:hypothetical protein
MEQLITYFASLGMQPAAAAQLAQKILPQPTASGEAGFGNQPRDLTPAAGFGNQPQPLPASTPTGEQAAYLQYLETLKAQGQQAPNPAGGGVYMFNMRGSNY